MEDIKKYLDQKVRSYNEGIALLTKYGKNMVLLGNLVKRGESAATWETLIYNLQKIAHGGRYVDEKTVVKIPKKEEGIKNLPEKVIKEEIRPTLADFKIKLAALHGQKAKLSNSLKDFKPEDNEGRKKVIDEIARKQAEIDDVLHSIQYIEKYNEAPPKEEELADNSLDLAANSDTLIQKKRNAQANISKYRNKLTNVKTPEERAKLEKNIAEWESIVKQVNAELDKRKADAKKKI